jgi:hypothetical protein
MNQGKVWSRMGGKSSFTFFSVGAHSLKILFIVATTSLTFVNMAMASSIIVYFYSFFTCL